MEEKDFVFALKHLMGGSRLTRMKWNGNSRDKAPERTVRLWDPSSCTRPDPRAMSLPFLYMDTEERDYVPWTPSQEDLFSKDWIVVY